MRFGRATPWEAQRVFIAEHFQGWRLDYIDNLSWPDLIGVCTVIAAEQRAQRDALDAQQWLSGGGKGT